MWNTEVVPCKRKNFRISNAFLQWNWSSSATGDSAEIIHSGFIAHNFTYVKETSATYQLETTSFCWDNGHMFREEWRVNLKNRRKLMKCKFRLKIVNCANWIQKNGLKFEKNYTEGNGKRKEDAHGSTILLRKLEMILKTRRYTNSFCYLLGLYQTTCTNNMH